MFVLQLPSLYNIMPKKGKKKVQTAEGDAKVEVISKCEIIYEYTKAIIGIEPEFRWGQTYQMIKDKNVLDVGFDDIPLY